MWRSGDDRDANHAHAAAGHSLPLELIVHRFNACQPEVLMAYPSVLRALAQEQIAGGLHIPLRIVATFAEVLPAETRQVVQEAWQVRLRDTYGATEYAPIASRMRLRAKTPNRGRRGDRSSRRTRRSGSAGRYRGSCAFDRFRPPDTAAVPV